MDSQDFIDLKEQLGKLYYHPLDVAQVCFESSASRAALIDELILRFWIG